MAEKTQGTIHIEWKRSGIGFTRRQRSSVSGLGLRRLHHVVEREDTPQVRGLVSAVPHLAVIVKGAPKPAPWAAIPEYTIHPKIEAPKADAPARRTRQPELRAEVPARPEADAAAKNSAAKREKAPKAAKSAITKGKSKEPVKKAAKAPEKPAKAKASKGKK